MTKGYLEGAVQRRRRSTAVLVAPAIQAIQAAAIVGDPVGGLTAATTGQRYAMSENAVFRRLRLGKETGALQYAAGVIERRVPFPLEVYRPRLQEGDNAAERDVLIGTGLLRRNPPPQEDVMKKNAVHHQQSPSSPRPRPRSCPPWLARLKYQEYLPYAVVSFCGGHRTVERCPTEDRARLLSVRHLAVPCGDRCTSDTAVVKLHPDGKHELIINRPADRHVR